MNRRTITRLRPPAASDGFGPATAAGEPDRLDFDNVAVFPITAGENNTNQRKGTTIGHEFHFPGRQTIDIVATDLIEWDGNTYQVDGDPAQYSSAFTSRGHSVAIGRRFEG